MKQTPVNKIFNVLCQNMYFTRCNIVYGVSSAQIWSACRDDWQTKQIFCEDFPLVAHEQFFTCVCCDHLHALRLAYKVDLRKLDFFPFIVPKPFPAIVYYDFDVLKLSKPYEMHFFDDLHVKITVTEQCLIWFQFIFLKLLQIVRPISQALMISIILIFINNKKNGQFLIYFNKPLKMPMV